MKFTAIALIATLTTVDALKISEQNQIATEAFEEQMSGLEAKIEANAREAEALRSQWGWGNVASIGKKYAHRYI